MLDAGAVEGEDMLPEVALVKLMWALANTSDAEAAAKMMRRPVAGEISGSTPTTV